MANIVPLGIRAVAEGTRKFTTDLKKMNKGIVGVGKSADGLGKKIAKAGVLVAKFGIAAGAAAVAGIAALGAMSIKTAISVESAFTGVAKTTDGLVDEFGKMTEAGEEMFQSFRNLAKEVPIAVEELLAIGELAGQLGVPKEALVDFTETVAALGVTTNLTTEEAASDLARLANIYQISSGDIAENTEKIGSTIVELGNNFATTERDILAFGTRIAGVGNIVGLTQADILGIGTAMASVGIEAESGGTAVQKVLIELQKAVLGTSEEVVDNTDKIVSAQGRLQDLKNALEIARLKQNEFTDSTKESTRAASAFRIEKLTRQIKEQGGTLVALQGASGGAANKLEIFAKAIGISSEEFIEVFKRDAGEAFQLFVTSLGEAGDDAISILADLGLEDQRLIRSFLSLSGAGDLLTNAMDTASAAFEDNVALGKEAQLRYTTMESQLKIFKNTLRDVGITIGSALLPFLNKMLKFAKPLIDKFGKSLPKFLDKFTAAIERIANAVSDIVFGEVNLEDILPPFLMKTWDDFIGVLDKFKEWWDRNGPAIREAAGRIFDTITETIKTLAESVIPFVVEQFGKISAWFDENEDNITGAIANIADFFENTLGPAVTNVWENVLKPFLGDFIDLILDVAGVAADALGGGGTFVGTMQELDAVLTDFFVNKFPEHFINFRDFVLKFFGLPNWEEVADSWRGVLDNLTVIIDKWIENTAALLSPQNLLKRFKLDFFGTENLPLPVFPSPSTQDNFTPGGLSFPSPDVQIPGGLMSPVPPAGTSETNEFNLTVNTSAPVEPILQDFRLMRAMGGRV